MSVADANRFRELEARVDAIAARPLAGTGSLTLPVAPDKESELLEVVAALQRRISSLEGRAGAQQAQINNLRLKLGLKSDAAAAG